MKLKLLLIAAYILVIVIGAWQAIPSISTYKRTGVLDVSTSSSTAQLSISQENHQAIIIGTGSANVRLSPGTYQVVATDSGKHASSVVVISKEHTTHTSLKLSSTPNSSTGSAQQVRTVEDITFTGTDALLNDGLTTDQVNELEQDFFQLKSSANTVTVDTSTVESGSRNPNTISPFTLDFTVTVDSTSYNAVASYMNTDNVKLQLFDPTSGKQVFTAGTIGS